LATLLFDLLTSSEERTDFQTGHLRFDVVFLASRLRQATAWAAMQPRVAQLPLGYFGASTGAAAALIAAADPMLRVAAVVSRGGRPDLAGDVLPRVRSPTLLIVGGADTEVLTLNEQALARLKCIKRLEIVPHATHLFEESGALHAVARLAADWFTTQLPSTPEQT
jgi:pimeloyl-ACP methyl ester carboxylesterase